MRITVVSGTNRQGNLSLKVAGICREILDTLGCETQLLDLRELPSSLAFQYCDDNLHPEFGPFQTLVDASSHFVFVVPEYNGSIPGILKLFIDACDYPDSFRGKSAVLVGIAAGTEGNQQGLDHLRDILHYLKVDVHEETLAVAKIRQRLCPDGKFRDTDTEEKLQRLLTGYLKVAFA
jgi:chromate reductase